MFSRFHLNRVLRHDILDMMEGFSLIAKFSLSPNEQSGYFVPAMVRTAPEGLFALKPSSSDPCPLYINFFNGFVPQGLFTQLVSRSVRWCSMVGGKELPKLYLNGARLTIGKDVVYDFFLICFKRFIKIVLMQKKQIQQIAGESKVAMQVLDFLMDTLRDLSDDLPYLNGLQFQFCIACPYCLREKCTNHKNISCEREDCLHLLELDHISICDKNVSDEVLTVTGKEKWVLKEVGKIK